MSMLKIRFRPAMQLDKIAWIMCRFFLFPEHKHCTNAIDPYFISQLPVVVKERLPSIFAGSRSIGIDKSLIQMMVFMSSKPILFRTFSNSVNEFHQIKYSKSMINYLDCAHASIINKKILVMN